MNDILSVEIGERVIGVVDLLAGHAVHAIAGDREHYQPVEVCSGDPLTLVGRYRDLGVSALYVADLDSISGGEMQVRAIDAICRMTPESETLVDIGWSGEEAESDRDAIANLAKTHSGICWIAATESMRSVHALAELVELVSPDRVLLGLDYRGGKLIAADADEEAWVQRAGELDCCGAVILDLASVGTSLGPLTIQVCQRIKRHAPTLSLYSGGGIRTAQDLHSLIQAGCDRCLVATALHEHCGI